MGFMVDRVALIKGFLRVHRVSLASMFLACFILVLHSSTSNVVRYEGLAASVNATFLSLSLCPPVWADSRSVIHGTGSLITVFRQEPPSGPYPEYEFSAQTFCLRSDEILITNLCLCFPSQIIRLEFWVYCSLAPLTLLGACIDCPRWKLRVFLPCECFHVLSIACLRSIYFSQYILLIQYPLLSVIKLLLSKWS
jgi:hypothetical protein